MYEIVWLNLQSKLFLAYSVLDYSSDLILVDINWNVRQLDIPICNLSLMFKLQRHEYRKCFASFILLYLSYLNIPLK